MNYTVCPICGKLTDDGAVYVLKKGLRLVCLDCCDMIPHEYIKERIDKGIIYDCYGNAPRAAISPIYTRLHKN